MAFLRISVAAQTANPAKQNFLFVDQMEFLNGTHSQSSEYSAFFKSAVFGYV